MRYNVLSSQSGLPHRHNNHTADIFPFIAAAVSLVTTGAHIGVQETQGQRAFYIAQNYVKLAEVSNLRNILKVYENSSL